MNYRVGPKREPIKRLQLRPSDLSSKYPTSLRPSLMRIWAWQFVYAVEAIIRGLKRGIRRGTQLFVHLITDMVQHLALWERTSRLGKWLIEWACRGFEHLRIFLGDVIRAGRRMIARMSNTTASWIRSRRIGAWQKTTSAKVHPMSPFNVDSADTICAKLPSERQHILRRELTDVRERLMEALLAEEQELTRVATRVVRLQSLIRAQDHFLAELAETDEPWGQNRVARETSIEKFLGVGKSSNEEEPQDISLYSRN